MTEQDRIAMATLDLYWLNKFLNVPADLTLTIRAIPPSMNNYLVHTGHSTFVSKSAKKFQALVKQVFHDNQYENRWLCVPIPVGVCIHLRLTDDHKDVDNHAKVLNDALTGLVWDDDAQIQAMYIAKTVVVPAKKQLVRDVVQTVVKVWTGVK